ncbi:MAG: hypothetical protein IKE22_07125 [Atopobiaceae bacterium]|nr:hypothetical protein [Atopobiaceae bacterium]
MHVRKAAVICNSCGTKVEIDPDIKHVIISLFAEPGDPLAGWLAVEGGRHLCPTCAAPYLAKKREMETELRRLSGARTVEFDI